MIYYFKKLYFVYMFFAKRILFPKAQIRTNFIMPGVKIGQGALIREDVKIYRNVHIGDYTFINENTRIDPNTKTIGKYCSISHDVKIGVGPHPLSFLSTSPVFYSPSRGVVSEYHYDEIAVKGYAEIGHDVFIACNAVILAGVKVGHGAVITASSVVVKDVPPYAVVGGNPAKVIKFRFPEEVIQRLLKSEWWNIDTNELVKHVDYISDPVLFLNSLGK